MMWLRRYELQKVVPVAGEEHTTTLVCKPENSLVGGISRKGFPQQCNLVAELLQQIAQIVGDVVIEQELQSEAGGHLPGN